MPSKTLLGKVKTKFDDSGSVVSSTFEPAEFTLPPYEKGGDDTTVKTEPEITAHATRVLAAYFIHIGSVEMADPDLVGITNKILKCDKHDGRVKYCEVAFYLTEKASAPVAPDPQMN